ncbi:MAG: TetR/AcrR family transcriptional regulator [Myxococcales bacterium]|nr:TetR/AcrR family transcriptional regulator [Myxococcales bacterium]
MAKTQTRNRIRQARREMYRQVITEAAEVVFADKGFANAKMSEVALEAGISLKTLYATFNGKLELFDAIRALRISEVMARTDAVSEGTPLEVTMNRVRVSVEYLVANPHFLRIHLREGNAWAIRPERVPGTDPDGWHVNMSEQAKTIQRGIDEGVFEKGDPELLVKMVSAVYQVQLADWLEREENGSADLLVRRIQDYVKRLLCCEGTF